MSDFIKFRQGGKVLFLGSLDVALLRELTAIDMWDPKKESEEDVMDPEDQGYQRELLNAHLAGIKGYVIKPGALLPTAILLSARKPLRFTERSGGSGTLELRPGSDKLFILDGQHRVEALKQVVRAPEAAHLLEMRLPVVIIEGLKKWEEALHFMTINDKQKRIRTDLADRLLHMLAKSNPEVRKGLGRLDQRAWKLIAVDIARDLNTLPDSPLRGRIQPPNATRTGTEVLKEASLVSSLRKVINSDVFEDLVQEGSDDVSLTDFLVSYWMAVKSLLPDAFENPADYVVLKTPGIYTLHMIAPSVYRRAGEVIDPKALATVLATDADHFGDIDFWKSRGAGASRYNSVGAFSALAEEIRRNLRDPE